MKLRDAVPADLPQMLEIYGWYVVNTAAVFEDDVPSEAEFRQRMEHIAQRYAIIAAEENGVMLGFAYAQPFSTGLCCDWSCEVCVFTAHDRRCKGIGTALTEKLIDIEKLAGMQNFYARIPTVNETNDEHLDGAAQRLAEKAGFAVAGRFTKCAYKFWKWYDMLWMEKLTGRHQGTFSLIPRGGMCVGSGADEEAIVRSGAAKVREVLLGDDLPLIRSVMCCLDGHFDPYYNTLLPDEAEICHALEELIVQTRVPDIAETACDLLKDSTAATDFPILRRNSDKVMRFVQPDVRALLRECGGTAAPGSDPEIVG